jgi:hypothetical protein
MGDKQAVRVLLELGADPNAGSRTTLDVLSGWYGEVPAREQIALLLAQHGADCLQPIGNTCLPALYAQHCCPPPGPHGAPACGWAAAAGQRDAGQPAAAGCCIWRA